MDLNDLTEINELAEALRARCEKAGAGHASVSWSQGKDLEITIRGASACREVIRLGAQPTNDWHISDVWPEAALRNYKLGVFSVLDYRPIAECDVTPAVVIPRDGAL